MQSRSLNSQTRHILPTKRKKKIFSTRPTAFKTYDNLKKCLGETVLNSIDHAILFMVGCNASDTAVFATLNQAGYPSC